MIPSTLPPVSPLRILLATIIALIMVAPRPAVSGPQTGPVTLIGEYGDISTSVSGNPSGFEVSLWREGAGIIGLVTYVDAEESFSCTSLIRYGTLMEETGAITLQAKMFLTERRHRSGDWGRAIESIEFTGTLTELELVGRFSVAGRGPGERAYFDDHFVTLRRHVTDGPTTYRNHTEWRLAHEHRVGAREIAVAEDESVSPTGRALQVGLAGGILRTGGDDARFFNTGGGHFGVDVLYTMASRFAFGARLSLSRFESNVIAVGEDVIPAGVSDAIVKAPESGFLFELSPVVRVSSANPAFQRLVGFLQASAGYYYVNLETPYSMLWFEGAHSQVENGSVGHVGHHFGGSISAGMSVRLSRSSRMEIAPEYHRTFGDSDLSLFGVMVHFRVEFLHD
jgi:hypothetical protein